MHSIAYNMIAYIVIHTYFVNIKLCLIHLRAIMLSTLLLNTPDHLQCLKLTDGWHIQKHISNAFSSKESFLLQFRVRRGLFRWVQLMISQDWFRKWCSISWIYPDHDNELMVLPIYVQYSSRIFLLRTIYIKKLSHWTRFVCFSLA